MPIARTLGAFLSGGLDSSTVTGLYGKAHPGAARTFTIGFDDQAYDETAYARTAARHFATTHHEYFVTHEDVFDVVDRLAVAFEEPFGNSSAVPTFYCADLARANRVETLLAGDGGDELFAGNAHYLKQLGFERYRRIPSAIRGGLIEPLAGMLAFGDRLPIIAKARRRIEVLKMPLPDRMEFYNHYLTTPLEAVFTPELVAEIDRDEPFEIMREAYRRPDRGSALQRMMSVDMQVVIADGDVRKVGRTCELAGIDVAFPFLSDDVVEFAAGIPAHVLLRNGELRGFYKFAMRDFLPDQILTKKKHGFGLPSREALREYAPLRDKAFDAIAGLKRRHILNAPFLDRLASGRAPDLDLDTLSVVWDMMMLELWFENHVDRDDAGQGGYSQPVGRDTEVRAATPEPV